MPPHGKMKIKRVIEINVGKPLLFDEELNSAQKLAESSLDYQQILEKITDKMMEELKKLTI
jgi:hypothetical protein